MKVTYTHFQSKGRLSKKYRLVDGKITKEPAAQMCDGYAAKIELNFGDFPKALEEADSRTAFGYGLFHSKDRPKVRIVTASEENPSSTAIARTKKNFSYKPIPGILMLDHDPSEYGPSYTPKDVVEILGNIHPAILNAARVVRGSVSAGVHLKGELPSPCKGFHIYIPVENAEDIPRYGAALIDRLWLNGHGFIALARNGAMLERTILDGAVFSPERLDFVGNPIIDDEALTYTPTPIDYIPGGLLDTTSLPDLTTEEKVKVDQTKLEKKAAIEDKSVTKQAEWAEDRIQEMERAGATPERAKETIERISNGESLILFDDFVLVFAHGIGAATVAEVLNNPEQYNHKTLADPIEGPDYGASTAKFYWNDGKPFINSFAHGETKYFLKNSELITAGALLTQSKNGNLERLVASHARDALAKVLKKQYAWEAGVKIWLRWTGTHWQAEETPDGFNRALHALIDLGCSPMGYGPSYSDSIEKLLKSSGFLTLHALKEPGLLPFENGILNLSTKELSQANHQYSLTWCLPCIYEPNAECSNIKSFLLASVNNDEAMLEFLRAWLAAVLFGMAELQKFLYLVGPGGTGKSTFVRLCIAMLGKHNVHSTTMEALENNRFETANIYGKRLVVINDASNWGGKVDNLKALTGQDDIRCERKGIQATGSFQYQGIVIATSNDQLNTKDVTSGVDRRKCVVTFQNVVSAAQRAEWQSLGGEAKILHQEIPGLINWLMELSPTEIRAIIENPPESARSDNHAAMLYNNPVAHWLVECCAPAKNAEVLIGSNKEVRNGRTVEFEDADSKLYPSYLRFCQEQKLQALSQKRFIQILLDTAKTLGTPLQKKRMGGDGRASIKGLRLLLEQEQGRDFWISEEKCLVA